MRDFVAQRRERRSGDRGRRSGGTAACEAGPTETGLYVLAAKAVEENALDVALVTMPASGRMLEVTPVMDDEFVAIFPPGEVDLPAQATPALLASRPLVLYEPGANTRRIVDDWFRRAGMRPAPIMELGSVEAINVLVGAGLGCSVLPRMAMGGSGPRAKLAVRPLGPRLRRRLAIVLRRDKPLHRGLREVVRVLSRPRGGPAQPAGMRPARSGSSR